VVSWDADCGNDMSFPYGAALRPAVSQPGFTAGPDDLLMARNAKGRFAGATLAGSDLGDTTAAVAFSLDGKLSAKRATGTLAGTVTIVDKATGNTVSTCQTGNLRVSATRAPGQVFGGVTNQDEPVVARVDAGRRRLSNLLITWQSRTCTPDGFVRFPEHLGNFRLSHSGAFNTPFTEDDPFNDGTTASFSYSVSGRATKTAVRGKLHVGMTLTDATGAQVRSCDSGAVSWKALTG
jgi:hypothetical protein